MTLKYRTLVALVALAAWGCACGDSHGREDDAGADGAVADASGGRDAGQDGSFDAGADTGTADAGPDSLSLRVSLYEDITARAPIDGVTWRLVDAAGGVVEGVTAADGQVELELPTNLAPYTWVGVFDGGIRSLSGIDRSATVTFHRDLSLEPRPPPSSTIEIAGSIRGRVDEQRVLVGGPGVTERTEAEEDRYAITADAMASEVAVYAVSFEPRFELMGGFGPFYVGIGSSNPLRAVQALPPMDPGSETIPSPLDIDLEADSEVPRVVPIAVGLPTGGVWRPAANGPMRAIATRRTEDGHIEMLLPVGPTFTREGTGLVGSIEVFDRAELLPTVVELISLDEDESTSLVLTLRDDDLGADGIDVHVPPILASPRIEGSAATEVRFEVNAPGWSLVRYGLTQELADGVVQWTCIDLSGVVAGGLPEAPPGSWEAAGFDRSTPLTATLSLAHSIREGVASDSPIHPSVRPPPLAAFGYARLDDVLP